MSAALELAKKFGVENGPQSGHFELVFKVGKEAELKSNVPPIDIVKLQAPEYFREVFEKDQAPIAALRYNEFGMCTFQVNRQLIRNVTADVHTIVEEKGQAKEKVTHEENHVTDVLAMNQSDFVEIRGTTIHDEPFFAKVSFIPS
ncbi:hypothetical protein M1328_03885 [Patescibacteria group bacterium]|nr:hypothetical protein [Patescibacteria group bacterium]